MHVVCLAVVRALLNIWTSGPLQLGLRLSKTQREIVSNQIIALRNYLSDEFARKPRDLSQSKHWKATEYHTFKVQITQRSKLADEIEP